MIDISILSLRAKMMRTIRKFFDESDFIEVETPLRINAPAPETHIICPPVSSGGFLRASPELQMKKLLALGMDKIYQIGSCFRDGEKGARHEPEFTMLEWYRANESADEIEEDLLHLISALSDVFPRAKALLSPLHITVRDAYKQFAGWDPWITWDLDRFDFDMATKIEPALKSLGAVVLKDYPLQVASLARVSNGVAERWEFYFNGLELANCFTELCDVNEQRARFEEARLSRLEAGEGEYPIDEAFFHALKKINSAGGIALGLDRLAMVLFEKDNITSIRVTDFNINEI